MRINSRGGRRSPAQQDSAQARASATDRQAQQVGARAAAGRGASHLYPGNRRAAGVSSGAVHPAFSGRLDNSSAVIAMTGKGQVTLADMIKQPGNKQALANGCHMLLAGSTQAFNLADIDPMTQCSFLQGFADAPEKHLFLITCCESEFTDSRSGKKHKKQSLIMPMDLDKWLRTEQARSADGIYDPNNRQRLTAVSLVLLDTKKVKVNASADPLSPLQTFDFSNARAPLAEINHRLATMTALLNAAYNRDNEQMRNDEWILRCLLLQGLRWQVAGTSAENADIGKALVQQVLTFSDSKKELLKDLFNSFQNLDFQESEILKRAFIQEASIGAVFRGAKK